MSFLSMKEEQMSALENTERLFALVVSFKLKLSTVPNEQRSSNIVKQKGVYYSFLFLVENW